MLGDIENFAEIITLVAIIFVMMNATEMFSADPYGSSLRYYTFHDGIGVGPGTNAGLETSYERGLHGQ